MRTKKCIILAAIFLPVLILSILAHAGQSSEELQQIGNTTKILGDSSMINLNLDEQTVIKLAEVILIRLYGERILQERPWKVTDMGSEFKIVGSFNKPPNTRGGVAEIVISKKDARVVSYLHGK